MEKLVRKLRELEIPIKGVIENMKTDNSPEIKDEIDDFGVSHLGEIRFDHHLENTIGSPKEILKTDVVTALKTIFSKSR